ncbi:extracellular solute-binding protein [Enterococcus faecium]|nr:extracellular solute-binding protein [Enterococcus faecium]
MSIKKTWSLSIAFLSILFFLSGCGKGTDSKSADNNTEVVEVLNDKGQGTGPSKTFVPILEKEAGLKVKFINTPDLSAYQTNIQQSLQVGDAPALFTWWTGSQLKELVKNDLLEDLTDQWDLYVDEGVSDQIKDALSVDGKVYGAPLNVIYNGIFYNKEIFDKYGLSAPKNLDEFLTICETLKSNGEVPIGIGNTWQSFSWPQVLMGSIDPDLYEEWTAGKVPFTDKRIKNIFYKWCEMINKGYFSDVQQDQVKDFAGKKTAMMYQATNLLTGLNDEYGMSSGKQMDMFVLPGEEEESKRTIYYEVAPLVVGKNSSNKENAKKVLTSYFKENVQQEYADKTGMSAVTNVSFEDPISKSLVEKANDSEHYDLKLRYYEQFTPEIVNLSIDEYWKIFSNPTNAQVDQSLETIQKAWEKTEK